MQLVAAETARLREVDPLDAYEDCVRAGAATECVPLHVPIVAAEPSADPVLTGVRAEVDTRLQPAVTGPH
ncbi:hypothetical protein [Micromonospora chalcea]